MRDRWATTPWMKGAKYSDIGGSKSDLSRPTDSSGVSISTKVSPQLDAPMDYIAE